MLSVCDDHTSLSEAREKANYRKLPRGTVKEILVALGDAFTAETSSLVTLVLTKAEWIRQGGWKYPKVTPTGHNFEDAYKSCLPPFTGVVDWRDERPSSGVGVYRTERQPECTSNVWKAPQSSECARRVVDDVPQDAELRIDPAPKECTNVVNAQKVVGNKAVKGPPKVTAKVTAKEVKGGTKRKVTATFVSTARRGKMSKTSNDTIPDVTEHGPWTALANPFIGLANVGSEGTEKRRQSTLPTQVMFAWGAEVQNAAMPHAV